MGLIINQVNWTVEQIAAKLAHDKSETVLQLGTRTPASVAVILHQGTKDIEMLFIQRASHDLDPWSGHIAFPGGKLEDGESPYQTACRETLEEVGIDLVEGTYLGRLSDIIGTNLPVRVACCIFAVDKSRLRPILNEEVQKLFWVTLSDLRDQERHAMSSVAFDNKTFEVPTIRLPLDNVPVLWGITYRLVMQLLTVLEDDNKEFEGCFRLPETVELDERETTMSIRESYFLDRDKAVLVVIDVQEKLCVAMDETVLKSRVKNIGILLDSAAEMNIPVILTEQYVKGLGATLPELKKKAGLAPCYEKMAFSCCGSQDFVSALRGTGRSQVIITGMETHVCVLQTVIELRDAGLIVHIVKDAVMSRSKQNWETAIQSMTLAGAIPTSTESTVFQLLKVAGTDEFKKLSKLVR